MSLEQVVIANDPELKSVSVCPERPIVGVYSNRYRREASHVERNLWLVHFSNDQY